jgi:hypothetical protein
VTQDESKVDRPQPWLEGWAGRTAGRLVPLLLLGLITAGLLTPWERGREWTSTGWDTADGRTLALFVFLMAWVYVFWLAGLVRQPLFLAALACLAVLAACVPVRFYADEIGARDPAISHGLLHTHPGVGLLMTFGGGLLALVYVSIHLLRELHRRRDGSVA